MIVVVSGLLIKFIPHEDPQTGEEINNWLKYIDPLLTLIMVVVIAIRAIPVIFSISEILIESVPAGIDTQKLMNEIVTAVPEIRTIHSLHVWRYANHRDLIGENLLLPSFFRATAKDIYATLHLLCNEDVTLSRSTNKYGREIQKIFQSYCIRHFTLQFEYDASDHSEQPLIHRCAYGFYRKRRGHTLDEPLIREAREAIVNI